MRVRRVVTGHDHNGKAVFASDEQVDLLTVALMPGINLHGLWGAEQTPTFPDDGSPTAQPSYFPPVGGYRFGLVTFPPAYDAAEGRRASASPGPARGAGREGGEAARFSGLSGAGQSGDAH
jgi:hypothetical protein